MYRRLAALNARAQMFQKKLSAGWMPRANFDGEVS
jgi:hypothetical protein